MKRLFRLVHTQARKGAIEAISQAPDGYIVEVKEPTRNLEQNAKLHALIADVSKQADYMGKRRCIEFWKGLFVSGWQIATGQKAEIIPGLEGEFINIRESTTTLSVKRMACLIEYVQAWAVMNEVITNDY